MRYKEGRAYPEDVYANNEEYFADIAKAYQTKLQILYDAGLRNAQIDDPNLACKKFTPSHTLHKTLLTHAPLDFCSEKMLAGWGKAPLNTKTASETLTTYIALYNACLSHRPPDMHIAVHICRGNFVNSRHFSEGGYDRVASQLFRTLNVDTYYLEYARPAPEVPSL